MDTNGSQNATKNQTPNPVTAVSQRSVEDPMELDGKQYSVSTGLPEGDKLLADQRRIEFAIVLKKDTPAFPAEYVQAKSVLKYIKAR